MATAAAAAEDSSSNTHSPDSPSDGKLRRSGLPSPWNQVVCGSGELTAASSSPPKPPSPQEKAEPSPPAVFSAGDDSVRGNIGNVGKKQAWRKPSNVASAAGASGEALTGGGGSGSDGGTVVMGAVSWPALSESTRPPQKSPAEGSVPVSEVQGPVTSHSQPKQGSATPNANHNSSTSTGGLAKQRSMKRGGGGGNRQGGFVARAPPPPLPLPAFPVPEMAQTSFTNVVPMVGPDSASRETRPTGGFAPYPHAPSDHSNQRSSNRRGSFGQHSRGDGRRGYHGGRRDQDYGNHDWSSSQSPHARDGHGHHHRPPGRGSMRPPVQGAGLFVPPQTVRPYGNPMVYPDVPPLLYYLPTMPPESFGGTPYFAGPPPPPHYFALVDHPLSVPIVQQIDYYFSDANLVKDEFLRSNMDDLGWVPITLIASFPRVQDLTDSIPFILDCLRASNVVEVQGDKIRRCDEWMKWIVPNRSPCDSAISSPTGPTYDRLATSFQKASLEEAHPRSTSVADQTPEF